MRLRDDRDAALVEMQQEQQEVGQLSGLAMVYYALGVSKALRPRAL
jgi:hypothetical protein